MTHQDETIAALQAEIDRLCREQQRSESSLQAILDGVPTAICITDPQGRFEYVNPAYSRLYGYSRETLIGQPFTMVVPPENHAFVMQEHQRFLLDGSEIPQTWTVVADNGIPLTIHASATRIIGRDEHPRKVTFVTDITGQLHSEQQLQRLGAVIESSTDFIAMATLEGQVLFLNRGGRDLAGIPHDADISLWTIADFFMPDDLPYVQEYVLPTVMQEGMWTGEFRLRHQQTGEAIPMFYNGFLVTDPHSGEPMALGTVSRDLRLQKEAEAERAALQQQVIDAQQAAIRELSTPLIPIADGVLIMPLIGSIDEQRSQQMLEALLEGVARHHATSVLLDITGVEVVDTSVANTFIQAAQAVRLLGAEVIMTGIQPQIAQTLVHLGIDLSGIVTYSTLQAGIRAVLRTG